MQTQRGNVGKGFVKYRLETDFCDALRLMAKLSNRSVLHVLYEFKEQFESQESPDGGEASNLRRFILKFFVERAE